jgi:hypothetical protein
MATKTHEKWEEEPRDEVEIAAWFLLRAVRSGDAEEVESLISYLENEGFEEWDALE